jgi:hypothetical protein
MSASARPTPRQREINAAQARGVRIRVSIYVDMIFERTSARSAIAKKITPC